MWRLINKNAIALFARLLGLALALALAGGRLHGTEAHTWLAHPVAAANTEVQLWRRASGRAAVWKRRQPWLLLAPIQKSMQRYLTHACVYTWGIGAVRTHYKRQTAGGHARRSVSADRLPEAGRSGHGSVRQCFSGSADGHAGARARRIVHAHIEIHAVCVVLVQVADSVLACQFMCPFRLK